MNKWKDLTADQFIAILKTLEVYELTFAAEDLGVKFQTPEVKEVLISLLQHQDTTVREGALLGLSMQEDITATVENVMRTDPSLTIRKLAAEILECP